MISALKDSQLTDAKKDESSKCSCNSIFDRHCNAIKIFRKEQSCSQAHLCWSKVSIQVSCKCCNRRCVGDYPMFKPSHMKHLVSLPDHIGKKPSGTRLWTTYFAYYPPLTAVKGPPLKLTKLHKMIVTQVEPASEQHSTMYCFYQLWEDPLHSCVPLLQM